MIDRSHQNSRKAFYGLPVAMAAVLGGVLYFIMGDAPALIFTKLAVVPLYLLAGRAASLLFPVSGIHPFSWDFLERQFLDALLLTCFLVMFTLRADTSFADVAIWFAFIPAYVGLMVLCASFAKRKERQAP